MRPSLFFLVWISTDGYLFIEGTPYGKPANGFYNWGEEQKDAGRH